MRKVFILLFLGVCVLILYSIAHVVLLHETYTEINTAFSNVDFDNVTHMDALQKFSIAQIKTAEIFIKTIMYAMILFTAGVTGVIFKYAKARDNHKITTSRPRFFVLLFMAVIVIVLFGYCSYNSIITKNDIRTIRIHIENIYSDNTIEPTYIFNTVSYEMNRNFSAVRALTIKVICSLTGFALLLLLMIIFARKPQIPYV